MKLEVLFIQKLIFKFLYPRLTYFQEYWEGINFQTTSLFNQSDDLIWTLLFCYFSFVLIKAPITYFFVIFSQNQVIIIHQSPNDRHPFVSCEKTSSCKMLTNQLLLYQICNDIFFFFHIRSAMNCITAGFEKKKHLMSHWKPCMRIQYQP